MLSPSASMTKVPALARLSRSPPLESTSGNASNSANAATQYSNVRRAFDQRAQGMGMPNARGGALRLAVAPTAGSATNAGGWRESGASSSGVVLMRAADAASPTDRSA